MRVVDIDRDMGDVIPTGTTRDSQYLFDRMTERTLFHAAPAPGRRVLDVASGFGQDTRVLAQRGATAIGAEPSLRMLGWAQLVDAKEAASGMAMQGGAPAEGAAGPGSVCAAAADATGKRAAAPHWVQAWGHRLPFADESFDAALCKGALDHFDQPERAIAEMARVTRRRGRVVLAIANFDSLACRVARAVDAVREDWLGRPSRRGRRHYDVPADHFTRYEVPLMCEQAARSIDIERVEGISLAWGLPGWTRTVERLPSGAADLALRSLGWIAARQPRLADVVIVVGRPRPPRRREAMTSR